MLSRILLTAALSFGAGPALAQTLDLAGQLPRPLGDGKVPVTVTLSGVPEDLHARGSADGSDEPRLLARRLQIFFLHSVLGAPLHFDLDAAAGDPAMPLYVASAAPHSESRDADGTWTYTYKLEIVEAVPGGLAATICGQPDCPSPEQQIVVIAFLGTGPSGDPIAVLDPPVVLTQPD